MIIVLILIFRFRHILGTSVYTVEKFLRLRRSSPDLAVALFLFPEYDLVIAFAAAHTIQDIISEAIHTQKIIVSEKDGISLRYSTHLSGEELLELAGL